MWLVDLAEWTYYDWLLQLFDYRYPITANRLITLPDNNYTKWLVKNKAANAPITFEEIVTVVILFGINKHEQIFLKTNKIAQALPACAIRGLWKN